MCVLGQQGQGRVWEGQAHTCNNIGPRRSERRNPPTVFIRARVTKLRCCFKFELLCLQMGDLRFTSLMLGWAWSSCFSTQLGSQTPGQRNKNLLSQGFEVETLTAPFN